MEDNKYQQGKIYKIVCNITNEVYYGSTINTLKRRLQNHTAKTKRPCMSKQILDRGDYKIELIKDYPCNNEEELRWEERRIIDNNICINKFLPIITEEEKIEKKSIASKNWYNKNKEEILEKHKQYYKDNKEEINEREKKTKKKYRENNKEEIEKKAKEKITCICGCVIRRDSLVKHKKSMKHIKLMECIIID